MSAFDVSLNKHSYTNIALCLIFIIYMHGRVGTVLYEPRRCCLKVYFHFKPPFTSSHFLSQTILHSDWIPSLPLLEGTTLAK